MCVRSSSFCSIYVKHSSRRWRPFAKKWSLTLCVVGLLLCGIILSYTLVAMVRALVCVYYQSYDFRILFYLYNSRSRNGDSSSPGPEQRSLRPQRARQICVLSNLSGGSASANFGEQSSATINVHVSWALCCGPSSSFSCSHGLVCLAGYGKAQHRNWATCLMAEPVLTHGGWVAVLFILDVTHPVRFA